MGVSVRMRYPSIIMSMHFIFPLKSTRARKIARGILQTDVRDWCVQIPVVHSCRYICIHDVTQQLQRANPTSSCPGGELYLSASTQTFTRLLIHRPIEHTLCLSYDQHLSCARQLVLLLFAQHSLCAPRSASLHRTMAPAKATQLVRIRSSKDRTPARTLSTLAHHRQRSLAASLPRRPTKTRAHRPASHRRHRSHQSRASRTTERRKPAEATVSQSTVPSPRF